MDNISNTNNTQQPFSELLQHIRKSQHKIFIQVNNSLIDLYWLVGKTISQKVQVEAWAKV